MDEDKFNEEFPTVEDFWYKVRSFAWGTALIIGAIVFWTYIVWWILERIIPFSLS